MTYPELNSPLRTDDSFGRMVNPGHHKSVSPLPKLNIGLVSTFPSDYMHLICLGVTRRLLTAWRDRSCAQRLPLRYLDQFSSRLLEAQKYWPSEFNRQPRSLSEVERWKATE